MGDIVKPGRVPHSPALARVLRKARDVRGLSRKELGALVDIPYSFVKIAEELPKGTLDEKRLRAVMAELGIQEIPTGDEGEPSIELRWNGQTLKTEVPLDMSRALTAQRKTLGKTQRETAFLAQMHPSALSSLERSELPVEKLDTDALCCLLTALQVGDSSPLGIKAKALGLRWVAKKRLKINWDEQPLGKLPDIEIARNLEVAVAVVWRARRDRDIPAVPRSKWKKATGTSTGLDPHDAGLLEPVPRLANGHVDWDNVPFGVVPDAVIARWIGCCNHTVGSHRRKRKIKKCRFRGRIDWEAQPLGKIPDTVIAKGLEVSVTAVASARRTRDIPAAPATSRSIGPFRN